MNWNLARLLVYLACLGASVLAMAGFADFDPATGEFILKPINLYAPGAALAAGALPGIVSSGLAAIALWRRWGQR